MRDPTAGSSHARLHFVEDQQQTMPVAQLAKSLQVAGRRQVDAALALDGFDQDGAGFTVDELGHGVEIAEGSVAEAGQERFESLVILGLPRRAQRSQGATVEAVEHTDDLVAARLAIEPRDLDGRLDRLGTAVAEEALASPAGALAQRLRQPALGFGVPRVRHMDELGGLL